VYEPELKTAGVFPPSRFGPPWACLGFDVICDVVAVPCGLDSKHVMGWWGTHCVPAVFPLLMVPTIPFVAHIPHSGGGAGLVAAFAVVFVGSM